MADLPIQPPVERPGLTAPALLVVGLTIFFGFRALGGESVDFGFQALFRSESGWLAPHSTDFSVSPFNWLAYNLPKALLIVFALWLIAVAIRPSLGPASLGRRRALYLLACLALVPVACTQLRAVTQMTTPADLAIYGGKWEHRLLFESKPSGYPSRAFPAGHASGGFALLGIAFAWGSVHMRRFGWTVGLLAGGGMGLHQIARGEHFLSHTLATAALAWLICAALARAIGPAQSTS